VLICKKAYKNQEKPEKKKGRIIRKIQIIFDPLFKK